MTNKEIAPPAILALDVGTSSVRALLYEGTGTVVPGVAHQVEYRMRVTPDGGVEMGADETVALVAEALDGALAKCPRSVPIAAVAVTTYWHNVVGLDASDHPVTPVISWADTRPRQAIDELRRSVDVGDLTERTGCLVHASYLPAKLLWLRTTFPEKYPRVARWMSMGEYLLFQLTGCGVCSYSMASGSGLLNGRSGTWDAELLHLLDLREEQLWPISGHHEPAGTLRKPWHERWPALTRAVWFPALGDGACSNLGAGCTTSSRAALMVGTSGALRLMMDQAMPERLPRGLWRYHADRRRVLVGGALSNGGNLVDWLGKTLLLPEPKERERLLAESLGRPHGLTVLPFLAGERAPNWRDDARGVVSGINLDTDPIDLYRAFLEAVAYRFAEIDDLLSTLVEEKPRLVATGGALEKSPAWRQILADVLGRPVTTCGIQEGSSRGAALMALESLGVLECLEDVPVPLGEVFEPDPDRHNMHEELRKRHQQLYEEVLGNDGPT